MTVNRCNQNNSTGVTLIEVLVVIVIIAILLALALPNFASTIRSNRLTTATNDLIAGLNLARSEAVKRGKDVVVRRAGATWDEGWEVFVDIDRSGANANVFNENNNSKPCEATEDCRLKVFPAMPPTITLRGRNNVIDFIRYTPAGISNYVADGLLNNKNDYFIFCDMTQNTDTGAPKPDTSRVVVLNTVGRAKLALDTDASKDGIPNIADGNVPSCLPSQTPP